MEVPQEEAVPEVQTILMQLQVLTNELLSAQTP